MRLEKTRFISFIQQILIKCPEPVLPEPSTVANRAESVSVFWKRSQTEEFYFVIDTATFSLTTVNLQNKPASYRPGSHEFIREGQRSAIWVEPAMAQTRGKSANGGEEHSFLKATGTLGSRYEQSPGEREASWRLVRLDGMVSHGLGGCPSGADLPSPGRWTRSGASVCKALVRPDWQCPG